jgi:chloride intracellular channel protein 2
MKNPEQEFKKAYNANPPVVVFHELDERTSQVVLTDNRDIDAEISKRFPAINMNSLKDAEDVCSNVYIKFHPFLKSVAGDQQEQVKLRALILEFKRINDYLNDTGTKFLSGNEMTFVDCDIMPKLQHIRVAGKYYKNFDIPTNFQALWSYMARCYQTKAFQESCPFDQDILMQYEGKIAVSHKPYGKIPTLQQPTMTLTIPE